MFTDNKSAAESRPPLSPAEKQVLKHIRLLQILALVSVQVVRALEQKTPYAASLARIRLHLAAIERAARLLERQRKLERLGRHTIAGSSPAPEASAPKAPVLTDKTPPGATFH